MMLALTLAVLILFIVVLIYLSGWFSGTETAFTHLGSTSVAEMRRQDEKNIKYIILIKHNMDRMLVAVLIGNNIVNIVLSAVAALVANALFESLVVAVIIGLITFLVIIFGEITPKHRAIMDSRTVAKRNARKVYYLMKLLSPLIDGFMFLSRKIIEFRGEKLTSRNLLVTDDSIKELATLGAEEGVIKSIEKEIIHKVFGFGDRKIRDIMVPMGNVFHLGKNYSIRQVKPIIRKHGFTRVPVINRERQVVGIVYSKDLLDRSKGRITSVMRRPYFERDDSDISDVFMSMKRKRVHMAIVVSASGEHVGIVTLEDILEELVGEIHDEYFEEKYRNGEVVPEGTIDEQGIFDGNPDGDRDMAPSGDSCQDEEEESTEVGPDRYGMDPCDGDEDRDDGDAVQEGNGRKDGTEPGNGQNVP